MSQDQVKPSAEALAIVWATLGDWDVSSSAVEAVALILDRERREARAEAFEEAARCVEKMYRSEGRLERAGDMLYDYEGIVRRVRERDASAIRSFAAKERAS